MQNHKLAAGAIGLCLALGVTGVATAAKSAKAPTKVTVKEKGGVDFKPNRWVKDKLRWAKDVYNIKSGGTITVVNNVADEGPHTFTVVKKKDLPKSFNCSICEELGQAHGADPNSDAPPQFQYLENGTGQDEAPEVDRPGDSALTGPGEEGEKVSFKVTAKKGTTLYFMCLIHPWMQAKVNVH